MIYKCIFCGDQNLVVTRKRRPVEYSIHQDFYFCSYCSGYSLWPALSEAEMVKMYSLNYIGDVNEDSAIEASSAEFRFEYFRNFLISQIESTGEISLLDYGCGADAQVLIIGRELGAKAIGVELDETTRAKAASVSSCVVYSPKSLSQSNISFDVVFLGDIIEHIYEPEQLLESLKSNLSPRASVFVQGPLEGAFTLSNFLLGIKCRMNAGKPSSLPPYHISLASFDSMQKLFTRSGYEIIHHVIREPLWPAKALGSSESFNSFSDFVFSVSKFFDMILSKIISGYGTRLYLIVRLK